MNDDLIVHGLVDNAKYVICFTVYKFSIFPAFKKKISIFPVM